MLTQTSTVITRKKKKNQWSIGLGIHVKAENREKEGSFPSIYKAKPKKKEFQAAIIWGIGSVI